MKGKIIQQGAEAIIIKDKELITKKRVRKSYRLPELDQKIRKQRTKKEFNLLQKASKLIPIPKILKLNENTQEIIIEFIEGKKLSEHLDSIKNKLEVCKKIGENLAKIHDNDIIHGDLTTSNMILQKSILYFIDFGLGFTSKRAEDKAVDLHLIKEALEAKHFKIAEQAFNSILEGYKISKNYEEILKRLKKVESRGRYKDQY
ncbi:MAG: KEOPS complex kinase/ATPase Bud32 [Nanoarchaeota archaeon]|nr:KEOPS complex kinase/ATPase Bud32 [Nanoarchaeota archaeon]